MKFGTVITHKRGKTSCIGYCLKVRNYEHGDERNARLYPTNVTYRSTESCGLVISCSKKRSKTAIIILTYRLDVCAVTK